MKKLISLCFMTLALLAGCTDNATNVTDSYEQPVYYSSLNNVTSSSPSFKVSTSSSSFKVSTSSSSFKVSSSSSYDYCNTQATKLKDVDDLTLCVNYSDFVKTCDSWFMNKTGISFVDYCIYVLEDVMSSSSDVKMSSSSTTNTVTIKPMSCTRSLTCTGNTITIHNCVDKIQSKAAANGNAYSSSTCNEIMFTCNCM